MAGKFELKIRGDAEIRKVLKKAPLPQDAQERLLREGIARLSAIAKGRAPGSLAGAISGAIERQGTRTVGRVRVAERTNKGFRYAYALDASKKIKGKTGRYRHRSGARTGKLTKSWFRGSKTGAKKEMVDSFEREAEAHLRSLSSGGGR